MLNYLYTNDYDDRDQTPAAPGSPACKGEEESAGEDGPPTTITEPQHDLTTILNNVSVYALADKYDIPDLKSFAKEKFRHRSRLQRAWTWTHEDLFAVLDAVYSTTPSSDRGLRDIISAKCAQEIGITTHADELRRNPRLREVMTRDATMAFDVLLGTMDIKRTLECGLHRQSDKVRGLAREVQARLEQILVLERRFEKAKGDVKTVVDFIKNGAACMCCQKSASLTVLQSGEAPLYVFCDACCSLQC